MKGLIYKVMIGHEPAGRALGGKERLDEWGNGRILVLKVTGSNLGWVERNRCGRRLWGARIFGRIVPYCCKAVFRVEDCCNELGGCFGSNGDGWFLSCSHLAFRSDAP